MHPFLGVRIVFEFTAGPLAEGLGLGAGLEWVSEGQRESIGAVRGPIRTKPPHHVFFLFKLDPTFGVEAIGRGD